MTFKKRLGTFFLLAGVILLFVFVTSVFSPNRKYEVIALIVGALLFGLGWRLRTAKTVEARPSRDDSDVPRSGTPVARAAAKKRGPLAALKKGSRKTNK